MNFLMIAVAACLAQGIQDTTDPQAAALERLSQLGSLPALAAAAKARILASLPEEGELRVLNTMQREKLAALAAVLRVHRRENDYVLKVVESRQARLGLYERCVLLITDTALRVLSTKELLAVVAHEIGHEYVWEEFAEAQKQADYRRMQILELVCDGVAILTLHRLGLPDSALVGGFRAMTKADRVNGIEVDGRAHPTLQEREQFVRRLAEARSVARYPNKRREK